jgi:hypothetical protein
MNCAQFVSGQPGPELSASTFVTDPICPPLSCSQRVTDPNQHARIMYIHEHQTPPHFAALRLGVFALKSRIPHGPRIFRLFPGKGILPNQTGTKSNRNRTEIEPKPNHRCKSTFQSEPKPNQKRIKPEPNPARFRIAGTKSPQNRAKPHKRFVQKFPVGRHELSDRGNLRQRRRTQGPRRSRVRCRFRDSAGPGVRALCAAFRHTRASPPLSIKRTRLEKPRASLTLHLGTMRIAFCVRNRFHSRSWRIQPYSLEESR